MKSSNSSNTAINDIPRYNDTAPPRVDKKLQTVGNSSFSTTVLTFKSP